MGIKENLNRYPGLKKIIHFLLVRNKGSRPRIWLKILIRFIHKIGRGVILQGRLDIFPFNKFIVKASSILESQSVINNGVGDVIIGERCVVGIGSVIIGPVEIHDDVILAQHVVVSGLNHNYLDIKTPISNQGVTTKPTVIRSGTWIGANVSILAGVSIGRNCVIGAGSVVTKDLPDYSLAIGNPARVIKYFDLESNSWIAK